MPVTEFSARADAANEAADRLAPLQRRKEHIRHAAKTDMLLAAEGVWRLRQTQIAFS